MSLVGGGSEHEGNVFAYNPDTGVFGPICDDTWDKLDVRVSIREGVGQWSVL